MYTRTWCFAKVQFMFMFIFKYLKVLLIHVDITVLFSGPSCKHPPPPSTAQYPRT